MIRESSRRVKGKSVGLAMVDHAARRTGALIGRNGVPDAVVVGPNHGHPFVHRDRAGIKGKIADRDIGLR